MPQKLRSHIIALCAFSALVLSVPSHGAIAELFGKAAASKTHDNVDSYSQTLSGAAGLAFLLFPQFRIEGRYTVIRNFQNKLVALGQEIANDVLTQTNIYSVSLDWDILGEKYPVQPYLMVGAGYLQSFKELTVGGETFRVERKGISANGGGGFRIRVGRSFALELEAFAYVAEPDQPDPLIDIYGNVGIRIFM